MKTPMKTCPVCFGTGIDWDGEDEGCICERCQGSGIIPVPTPKQTENEEEDDQ